MTWVAYVACVGAKTDEHNFLAGKYEGKDHLECVGVVGMIILKLNFRKEECEDMSLIYLTQDRHQWWGLATR
jgi:hypothetical protein